MDYSYGFEAISHNPPCWNWPEAQPRPSDQPPPDAAVMQGLAPEIPRFFFLIIPPVGCLEVEAFSAQCRQGGCEINCLTPQERSCPWSPSSTWMTGARCWASSPQGGLARCNILQMCCIFDECQPLWRFWTYILLPFRFPGLACESLLPTEGGKRHSQHVQCLLQDTSEIERNPHSTCQKPESVACPMATHCWHLLGV